jgi:N-glycosylase/DNA lyase
VIASFASSNCLSAETSAEETCEPCRTEFPCQDYNLSATLSSGQVFRWNCREAGWEGVVGSRWIRLSSGPEGIVTETALPCEDWNWLRGWLRVDEKLSEILATFPDDEPMRAAAAACTGLRLLRQDPWECLASFILSSTKQIVQIRQIVALLCERFGEPVVVPAGRAPQYAFPTPERIAAATDAGLRACKMGFRAPYLLATARRIVGGGMDLRPLSTFSVSEARARLMELPGVGRKVADCVLLFGYGFQAAFPVDVWVMKALRRLYFPGRRVAPKRLQQFTATHFGPNSGYAQQYLFHYMRVHRRAEA